VPAVAVSPMLMLHVAMRAGRARAVRLHAAGLHRHFYYHLLGSCQRVSILLAALYPCTLPYSNQVIAKFAVYTSQEFCFCCPLRIKADLQGSQAQLCAHSKAACLMALSRRAAGQLYWRSATLLPASLSSVSVPAPRALCWPALHVAPRFSFLDPDLSNLELQKTETVVSRSSNQPPYSVPGCRSRSCGKTNQPVVRVGGVMNPITCPTGTLTLAPGAAPATSYDGTSAWTTTLPVAAGSTSYSTISFLTACTTQLPANTAVRGIPSKSTLITTLTEQTPATRGQSEEITEFRSA